MATITFRSASGNYATAQKLSISPPAGIQDNDILVAFVDDDGGNPFIDYIGWTFLELFNESGFALGCWHKVASSESGDYEFGNGGGTEKCGVILCFYNSAGTDIWVVDDSSQHHLASAVTIATNSVTGVDSSVLCAFYGNDDNEDVSSPPPDMTLPTNGTQKGLSLTANGYYEARSAGAVTKSLTYAGGGEQLGAVAVAISAPSVGGVAPTGTLFGPLGGPFRGVI